MLNVFVPLPAVPHLADRRLPPGRVTSLQSCCLLSDDFRTVLHQIEFCGGLCGPSVGSGFMLCRTENILFIPCVAVKKAVGEITLFVILLQISRFLSLPLCKLQYTVLVALIDCELICMQAGAGGRFG